MEVFMIIVFIASLSIGLMIFMLAMIYLIIGAAHIVDWALAHADGRPRGQSAASEVVPSTTEEERPTNGRWPSE